MKSVKIALNVFAAVHTIPSYMVRAEIKCTVHITLPLYTADKPVYTGGIKQTQVLRAYCFNIYTLISAKQKKFPLE